MAQTAKNIVDSLLVILTRFGLSDDSRLDPDFLLYKINQVRAELIVKQYAATNQIDYSWLSDLGAISFHRVKEGDIVASGCCWDNSKTTIPQVISLINKDGSLDLGVYSLTSTCGKTIYHPSRISQWHFTPKNHSNSLFGRYARVNTSLYIDRVVEKLRLTAILLNPLDGIIINSAPVPSGSLVGGTSYYVMGGQVIYGSTVYQPESTFVAGGGILAYTGSGTVYLASQVTSFLDTSPYPAGGDMIRAIELEILTKEFGIERNMIADIRNDSKDDASKSA